ncbi:hypothetical protein E3P86_04114 [Wallemia ichthyophaga]|nr:hypothetical protein E3P86_04114 [Wallemia ichthyophaga]
MAMHSFDDQVLTPIDQPPDKLQDLTADQVIAMNEWIDHFKRKYYIVGCFPDLN